MEGLTSCFTFFHKPVFKRGEVFHKKMLKVFKIIYRL